MTPKKGMFCFSAGKVQSNFPDRRMRLVVHVSPFSCSRSHMLFAPNARYKHLNSQLASHTTRLTCAAISYRLRTPRRSALFLPTSKNRFNHQTWKIPSPTKTIIWKMLHHLTLPFVLSAVLRWVRSRTTM